MDEASQQAGSTGAASQSASQPASQPASQSLPASVAQRAAIPTGRANVGARPAPAAADNGALHAVHPDNPLPALSLHFPVPPSQTCTWRVQSDAVLRVYGERVWLTRARSPYDHWLDPGDTLRLQRGERIWVSTDGTGPARVSLTSPWSPRRTAALRWVECFAAWIGAFTPGRASLRRASLRRAR